MRSIAKPRWKHVAIASAITIALVGGHALTLPEAAAITKPGESTTSTVKFAAPNFAPLVEHVKPAVVSIAITGTANHPQQTFKMPDFPENSPFGEYFRHFFEGQPGIPDAEDNAEHAFRAVGSGFIISADGYVVTNNHVIEHADEIEIIMHDGKRHPARITGRDPKTDLALLKIKNKQTYPFVELGNSDDARVGEWVVAVGNPFGLGGTVTAGIISARGRDIQAGPFDDFLQIDAPINRGNSGGPLFDHDGKVIGINTAIYSPSGGNVGIGFAIPSNMAKDVIQQLKDNGSVTRGWLGVQIQPVTEEIADSLGLNNTSGALVASVVPDSPADKGGIKAGDIILQMNGEKLENFKDLPKRVAQSKAGSDSTLEIRRKGKKRTLEVQIGRMPTDDVEVALADSEQDNNSAKLGIYLAELTADSRQRYSIAKDTDGVLVAGVKRGSPASKAGIRTGSVISMVGQEPVHSPDEVIREVKQAAEQKQPAVLLRLEQNGMTQFVAVKFASA